MEFKKFKKFNYINASKKFCNHFHYICLYYRHTHYGISQRQHVFRVYVIHSNCARLYNFFFFMMDYGENSYLYSKIWAKATEINNRVVGINMSWVKKNQKIKNRGGGGGRWAGLLGTPEQSQWRSLRYDINRPGFRHRHKYSKYQVSQYDGTYIY